MDLLTAADLRALVERREAHGVSIYMPTQAGGPAVRENSIRFKDRVSEAEEALRAGGMRAAETRALLEPAYALQRDARFWENQALGLALFLAPGYARHFRAPLRFPDLAVVARAFHIKPLLPLLMEGGRFYILALSHHGVRLYLCTRHSVSDVTPESMPAGLEAVTGEIEPLDQLAYTGTTPRSRGGRARFPGHGVEEEKTQKRVFEYFNEVDNRLRAVWREDRAPLVLAGVEYLFPLFRQASEYPNILPEGILGNAHLADAQALHARAWKLIEPGYAEARQTAADRYHAAHRNNRTTDRIEEALPAAHDGRVAELFVAVNRQVWGQYDWESGTALSLHEKPEALDVDLLDVAASETLRRKGFVYALDAADIPGGGTAAAILRY